MNEYLKNEDPLELYREIYVEYIVHTFEEEGLEHIYWKFPNNFGAWLYYKSPKRKSFDDDGQMLFDDWIIDFDVPYIEVVPIRYPDEEYNEKAYDTMIEASDKDYIVIPDYTNQTAIEFAQFDPEPSHVINMLTKLFCYQEPDDAKDKE